MEKRVRQFFGGSIVNIRQDFWRSVLCLFIGSLLLSAHPAFSMGHSPTPPPPAPPSNLDPDVNWVALNIFDTFYPMTTDQTFPDALASLEVIYDLYTLRSTGRDLQRSLGGLKTPDNQGERSREGHFTIWIHLSDHYLAAHPLSRTDLPSQVFMFPDRQSDIFTGWGGQVNLPAVLTKGLQGFTQTIKDPSTGAVNGNFQNFMDEIAFLGDADYEGGWYMSDDQAAKILTVFDTYPGPKVGYSFMSSTQDRPSPYEPAGAQAGNGYNCGDFAFYALNTSGVISKDETESLKTNFWYPKYYFDHAMPLQGAGAGAAGWLNQNPGATAIPYSEMINVGWSELIFGTLGLIFFDKGQIARDIVDNHYELYPARIWDQAHPIAWLKQRADFNSKGIWSELYPAVLANQKITSPVRTVPADSTNRFLLSSDHVAYQNYGDSLHNRKKIDAGISGFAGDEFTSIFNSQKVNLQ